MFSRIRKRLTYANVVMTLAFVFAMTGGAFAANKYLITSKSQIKPSVLKQLQGKAGSVGAEGKQGPPGEKGAGGANGTNGKDGTNGINGTDGTNGVSPEGVAFTGSAHGCTEGGIEFKGANTTYVCNGVKGTTGYTETLPPGKSETGTWGYTNSTSTFVRVPISFSIPLEAKVTPHFVTEEQEHGREGGVPAGCTGGTLTEPKAEPGNLCVYGIGELAMANSNEFLNPEAAGGGKTHDAGRSGTIALFNGTKEANGDGVWIVTAPS
jgi:hypothetical protein